MKSAPSAAIAGRWQTPDKDATIEIYLAKDGAHYGKLVAAKNPKAKPGALILRKLKKKKDAWVGKLYVAKRDRIVDVKLSLKGAKLKLKVSAGFRTKTLYWTRAK